MCPREKNKTPAVAGSRMLPKLITCDESTGCALTAQDEESEIKAEATTPQLRLPWRVWHAHASGLGRQEAAMRCALQALHMLHVNQVYDDMPIDIHVDETKHTKHVEATGVIPAESILLPPCVPKCKHLSAESVRPHRVAITVREMSRVPVAEPESSGPGIRRPKRVSQKKAHSAVAEKAAWGISQCRAHRRRGTCSCSRSCGIAARLRVHMLCDSRMARATVPICRCL